MEQNVTASNRGDVIPPAPPDVPDSQSESDSQALPEWLHELYPFRTSGLLVGSERMSYVDEGAGDAPPLVLLHDNPGWSFSFRKIIPALRSQFRVIAPDMVGFGLSSKPRDAAYHTVARHAENLRCLLDELDLKRATFLLHGWAGPIALSVLIADPSLAERIVLANAWAGTPPNIRAADLPLRIRMAEGSGPGRALMTVLGMTVTAGVTTGVAHPLPDLVLEGYKYPFQSASRCAVHALWKKLIHPDKGFLSKLEEIDAGLKNIDAAIDIVWGSRDPILGKDPGYALRRGFRNRRGTVIVDDASHFVMEDAPEVLITKLLDRPLEHDGPVVLPSAV